MFIMCHFILILSVWVLLWFRGQFGKKHARVSFFRHDENCTSPKDETNLMSLKLTNVCCSKLVEKPY